MILLPIYYHGQDFDMPLKFLWVQNSRMSAKQRYKNRGKAQRMRGGVCLGALSQQTP